MSGSYSDCSAVFYIKDCGGSNSDAWHTHESCGGPWKDTRRANYMTKVECEEISKSARLKSYNDCPECPDPKGPIGVSNSTVFNLSALTTQQKELFNTAKEELEENCLGAALLAATNQVNITMGATIASGQYQPDTNTIKFMSNGDISSDILGAELFHAYQQQLYGTLSDIYDGTKTTGGSNMEFEEKAFNIKRQMIDSEKDVDLGDGLIGVGEPITTNEEVTMLYDWLNDLEFNHATAPIVLNQSELAGWFDALEEFQQFHEENNPDLHYADPIDYNQNPNAILHLINRALEADCN